MSDCGEKRGYLGPHADSCSEVREGVLEVEVVEGSAALSRRPRSSSGKAERPRLSGGGVGVAEDVEEAWLGAEADDAAKSEGDHHPRWPTWNVTIISQPGLRLVHDLGSLPGRGGGLMTVPSRVCELCALCDVRGCLMHLEGK